MSLIPYYLYFPDLKKYGVQLVMTTDPIRRTDDLLFVAAKKLYIPITTLVLSWDNLTSKGRINDGYDCVMAWNELMKQEILSMYPSYTNDTVKVVGYPRFDIYKKPLPSGFEREPFLKSLGLDPANRVLLYANAPIRSFPVQPQIIDHVYQAMMNGQLPQDTQLLIRCHPHDDLAIYDIFRNCPRVAVWPGDDRAHDQTLFNQMPQKDELLILAASMKHSALCINPGSSVMLDAAICDIPIVCIAYDGDCILPRESSYATCYEYSHQKPFHQIGATDICYSKEELIRSIQKALAHPEEKSAQRKIIVDRYLGGESSSANRIRKVLMDLC
jgi:CDP-glycerol glycerophosphotransferase (TagB/SpsB family)